MNLTEVQAVGCTGKRKDAGEGVGTCIVKDGINRVSLYDESGQRYLIAIS